MSEFGHIQLQGGTHLKSPHIVACIIF